MIFGVWLECTLQWEWKQEWLWSVHSKLECTLRQGKGEVHLTATALSSSQHRGWDHRSITSKFLTPTVLSCIDNSWRSTTLSPPKKLTSSTANFEWCHSQFIRDSYSTFIRRVIGPSKNSMELFFNAKFDFKSTWNLDSTTSHHKHPVCQSLSGTRRN